MKFGINIVAPRPCIHCNKMIQFPTATQRYCSVVCRMRAHTKVASSRKAWFRPKDYNPVAKKKKPEVVKFDWAYEKLDQATKDREYGLTPARPEPTEWKPRKDKEGRRICPRCYSCLQSTEDILCEWCVRDRARLKAKAERV